MNTFRQAVIAASYILVLLFAVLLLVHLQGCTVVEEKTALYQEVASKFSVPDKVEACYKRDGEKTSGAEARCFGDNCTLPDVSCDNTED